MIQTFLTKIFPILLYIDSDSSNKYKNEWALLLDMHQKESELETIEMKRENQLRKLKYR